MQNTFIATVENKNMAEVFSKIFLVFLVVNHQIFDEEARFVTSHAILLLHNEFQITNQRYL